MKSRKVESCQEFVIVKFCLLKNYAFKGATEGIWDVQYGKRNIGGGVERGWSDRGRESIFTICIFKALSSCYISKIRYAASEARIELLERN